MLHKLLSEYPEDIIRRSSYYQYRKPIDLYVATPSEIELLNRINVHHSHWAYSRQAFTAGDELVCVSDFLPFYEHLRVSFKPSSSIPRTTSIAQMRPTPPQAQPSTQRSLDFVVHMPNTSRRNSSVSFGTPPVSIQPKNTLESPRESMSAVSRSTIPAPPALRPPRPLKYGIEPLTVARQSLQQQLSFLSTQQPTETLSNSITNSANKNKEGIEDNQQLIIITSEFF